MSKPGRDRLKICAQRCDQCLFSPNRIVSTARMRQILADCERDDEAFECHKHTTRRMDGEDTGGVVVCRGFYDRDPRATTLLRLGAALGLTTFVDEEGNTQ